MKPDIDVMKRQIVAQLDDYERVIEEYRAYMDWWRSRQPTRMFTDEIGEAAE